MAEGSGDYHGAGSAGIGDGGEWEADAVDMPSATGPEAGASRTAAPPPSRHAPRLSFEAVVRIEFNPDMAERIIAGHRGVEVDYAVNLWSRHF